MKKLICISCPVGCRLTAEGDAITGNKCPRGIVYAKAELTDPRRVVTATVSGNSEQMPRIPVRTTEALPKRMIAPLLGRLYKLNVKVPVKNGEVLLTNVENTGIDVIFTSDCLK